MNNLQEISTWVNDQEEKARKHYVRTFGSKKYDLAAKYKRKHEAFSLMMQGLALLLNSENENSSQSSQEEASNSSNAM